MSSMTRHAALAALLACAVPMGGCSGGSTEPEPAPSRVGGDGYTVEVGSSGVKLERGSDVLLRFPADGIELGRVDAIDDNFNYDPYPIATDVPNRRMPAGFAWLALRRATPITKTATTVQLRLVFDRSQRATLDVKMEEAGSFTLELVPDPGDEAIAYFRLRPVVDKKEGFYGLGEYFDNVDNRGHIRAMQLELGGGTESGYNDAHVPVPFVVGTRGWGLFVENPYPATFDMAATEDDRADVIFGTGAASKDGLTFHLFAADHPLDVTKHYYEVTGFPRLPARWALGPWIWRNENKDQAQVESDLDAIRDQDLATTGYWIDRPYATAVNTFDFNPAQFTDPAAMITKMHALGFRTALWHTPYEDEKTSDAPKTKTLRDYAASHGFYPEKTGLLLNKWGRPIDLTNPDAYAWWQGLIHQYTDAGVEGFKLDYGEDIVPGVFGGRNVWQFADGSDERTMHSRFQLFYHRVYAETLPASGGFLLCRRGTYGDQKNVSVIWPGDLDATFSQRGDKVTQKDGSTYVATGGLPASVIAGLSLGPSGFPFYASDTGGYRHSPPDKELFTRWFEQTALSSAMEIGTSSNDVAWEPTPANGFDAEMLGWYRTYTRLHLRLWPYEWTYAKQLAVTGRPIERALGLAHPELGENPGDEYLFGDSLLVAPVLARGKTTRDVILPDGSWVNWWTGQASDGGQTIHVAAPLDRLPLFQLAGSVVPLLRPTIDSMAPTTDPARVDSYATTPGVLYPRVAPGKKTTFTLFDGTELGQEKTSSGLSLSAKPGSEFKLGVLFEVVGVGQKPSAVTESNQALAEQPTLAALEAAQSGWSYDAGTTGGTLYVKVTSGQHAISVN